MSADVCPDSPALPPPQTTDFARVSAVQHIKRMRGGSQAHLMLCSDGGYYVVKFQNNPQHRRVLANEMLATRLAQQLGLPVPRPAVVKVGDDLVQQAPELTIRLPHSSVPCEAGLQFGSQYAVSPLHGQVFDDLSASVLGRVRNLRSFAAVLALDKWTGNVDSRQAAFWRRLKEKNYTAAFIDQGYCFNAGEWTFPDHPLRGTYWRCEVYRGITGWASFEPCLSGIEELKEHVIWTIAREIPPEWYEGDRDGIERLAAKLIERRKAVRDLVSAFRRSTRGPFPDWGKKGLATEIPDGDNPHSTGETGIWW